MPMTKEERREYNKAWRAANPEYHKTYNKEHLEARRLLAKKWRAANPEKTKMSEKIWKKANLEKVRDIHNKNKKRRRKIDLVFKIRCYISTTISNKLRKYGTSKDTSCTQHLSYTMEELKQHLEKQFEPWMSWDNYGKYNAKVWIDNDQSTWTWSIDHIIPQSNLPYTSMTDENFEKCWSLDNLRPLSSKQNNIDGVRRIRHG